MIKEINVRNFKSLKRLRLLTSNLNVLTGLNSSGKSSLIQLLLLLKQSKDIDGDGRLDLNVSDNNFISLGKGRDVFYQYSSDDFIQIGLDFENHNFKWKFKYASDQDFLKSPDRYSLSVLKECNLFSDNFQYLNAERIGPRQSYNSSYFDIEKQKQIGNYGEYAVQYLNIFGDSQKVSQEQLKHKKSKSNTLMHQVEAWLSEISPGTRLNTTGVPGTEIILLDYQFETNIDYTNRFRPINVGFGISYVLPVILSLLMAREDRLIIIENPEAHLHPRGQAEMGRLISLAASTGAQIFIETHSDHLINGIRVAVKNRLIHNTKAKLFFFERKNTDTEQYSIVSQIDIDTKGELNHYPHNLLSEWSNQLFKLV